MQTINTETSSKQIYLLILLLFISNTTLLAQSEDSTKIPNKGKNYSFIFQDSPARLFTMRQFNIDYLSSYRFLSTTLDKSFKPIVNYSLQSLVIILGLGSLTHEEGHRSILSEKNIGSISQPFYFSKRDGFVDGVTDQTLINLRTNNFPDFIRLYTAGSESDYMLCNQEESLMAFKEETFRNLAAEYLIRKASLIQYYLLGFFHYDIDGEEETNELKRDVVGNDVYGATRHLFRPTMPFHRYTLFNDLTSEEKNFVFKMGYRSLFNLINLNMIGIPSISISRNLSLNFGMGHILCPFGDLTDENFWIHYKKFKVLAYVREFQNKANWFMAGGIGLKDYPISGRIATSLTIHGWEQPLDLDFNETAGKPGGAIDFTGKYFFYTHSLNSLKKISIDVGFLYKSKGFLPEEVYLSKHLGFRLGATFNIE
jgi:hypothetical protein